MAIEEIKFEKQGKTEEELNKLLLSDEREEELKLSGGASAISCTIIGTTIGASVALCPTTKCTSECGNR